MIDHSILIYISENNSDCESVLQLLDELNVPYKTKNITKDSNFKRELENLNIYGTPATFIGEDKVILGAQLQRIRKELGH